jgi:integrase
MANARFYLKSGGTTRERLIYLFFSYDNNRLKYSTGLKVAPEHWNEKQERVRELKDLPQSGEMNFQLGKLAKEAERLYLHSINKGQIPPTDELRAGLDKIRGKSKDAPQYGLFSFVENFIEVRANSPKIKKVTVKTYRTLSRKLQNFAQTRGKKRLDFKDITPEFWEHFRDYLYSLNHAENTVHKLLRTLKTILADAAEKGAMGEVEVYTNTKRLGVSPEPVQKIYLSLSELETLFNLDLSGAPKLARVRDLFLIGAFTGLRFSDFTQIRPEHFKTIEGVEVLEIDTEKTGERVVIPVHPYFKAILKANGGQPPRSISNQKMNDYLKELGELAGFNEPFMEARKVGGLKRVQSFRKFEKLCTHTARRSFATNAYKEGVPSLAIMKITGHRTEGAFMRYIQITKEENALLMARNKFFNMTPLRVAK